MGAFRYYECPACGVPILNRSSVSSSNLSSVGWEADEGSTSGTLEVEFRQGMIYQYVNVPEWAYQGLLFSRSPGRYLREQIVDQYEGQRIE